MPSNDEETPVLNSTKLAKKSGSKKKGGTAKPAIRKARPLKNVSATDLDDRTRELKKRVATAECKTLLLRDRFDAHNAEIALREQERETETQTL